MGQKPSTPGITGPNSSTTATSNNASPSTSTGTAGAQAASSSSPTAHSNNNNRSSSHRHHHHHRHRTSRQNSYQSSSSAVNAGSVTTGGDNSNIAAAGDMSPRTRFRHEMTRRGYGVPSSPNNGSSSSDLFFRLFQLSSPNAVPPGGSSSSSNSSSGFRFFNLNSHHRRGSHGGAGGSSTTAVASNNTNSNSINDLDSELSSDDDDQNWTHNMNSLAHSLPFFFGMRDLKCFVCNKIIPADDVEAHIMMCLTKPRLTYNEDVLTDEKGECVICLEELEKGQTIARLPCLCIYHKHCIDNWLNRSQSCPAHPPD